MVHKTVYLAGPISGCTYDEATHWRNEVREQLTPHGIKCQSPMRAAVHLRHAKGVLGDCEIQAGTKPAVLAMSTPKGVVTRDKFDATRCSILFVNLLGAKKVSVGTCVEIGWADANDVPIVLVMEKGNIHEHAFITESASFVTDNINDAINIVRAILADY